jgi:homoserine kinase
MKEVFLRAPATIANVGPGFDIFAFALDHPGDRFRVVLGPEKSGLTIRLVGRDADIPLDPDKNTAGLAAKQMLRRLGSPSGAEIEIRKGMPSCSGLGSSAASAAAAVFGLDRLLGLGLTDHDLVDFAREGEIASGGTAHADNVAGCLLGGFVFIRRDSPLDIVRLPMPEVRIVVRVQKKALTTTRGRIAPSYSLAEVKRQTALCAEVMRAVASGDAEAFGASIDEDLVSEPARSRVIAGYAELKGEIRRAGAWGSNVSGGGSSIFAVVPEAKADAVAVVMRAFPLPDGSPPSVIVTASSNMGVEVDHGR